MTDTTLVTDAASLTITPIPVPASLDAPDAGPFLAIARLSNTVCLHETGHDHFRQDPIEMFPWWLDQTDTRQFGFTAERDGEIVGILTMSMPLDDGATALEFDLMVEPARTGEGIEDALLARLESEARALGRSVLQTWTLHRPDQGGRRLASPSGFGSIPAEDRQTLFMQAGGFGLEQVERNSVFDLHGSPEPVERMLADALTFAGEEYRVVSWSLPTPDAFKEGFGYAMSRMSTDVPSAALEFAEEIWDAARVERRDKRLVDSGRTVSVACVQHVPTGTIVAYNELTIAEDHSAPTHQWGTLVLKEHRGHRLGTVVKCANLLRWRDLVPESPLVSTFNAEESRPMLDINEAIGFVPASYAGAWKKTLA